MASFAKKKLAVGSVLSSINVVPVVCGLCDKTESFEHLFFECIFARKVWSIFLSFPIDWNKKLGLSWSEILAGYVESLNSYKNIFWFVLTSKILWILQKYRNKWLFQLIRRFLTKFNLKLIHFYIMSQVSMSLEIPKRRFMKLIYKGSMLIYKDDVKAANYINQYQSFLTQEEIDYISILMEKCHLDSDNNRGESIHHYQEMAYQNRLINPGNARFDGGSPE